MSNINTYDETLDEDLQSALATIRSLLSRPDDGPALGKHQIHNAASSVIEKTGYKWILRTPHHGSNPQNHYNAVKNALTYLAIKRAVKKTLRVWHSDPGRAWRAFKYQSLKIAAVRESVRIIDSFRC